MNRPEISHEETVILLGNLVANHKADLVYILQRNGISISPGISQSALIKAVLSAIQHSPRVREEISQLATQTVVADRQLNFSDAAWGTDPMAGEPFPKQSWNMTEDRDGIYLNQTGVPFVTNPSPESYQPGGDPNDPSTANWGGQYGGDTYGGGTDDSGGSFWDKVDSNTINSAVNFGLNIIGNALNKKQNEKDHAMTMAEYQSQIDLAAKQQGSGGGSTGISPVMVAGIAAGGLAVIVIIALVVQKSKKE